MQYIYTCPVCGSDLQDIMLTSNPPIYEKVCLNCGWSVEKPREDIVRIPYPVSDNQSVSNYSNNSCTNCSNNPKNGGSGICHCTLGNIKIN